MFDVAPRPQYLPPELPPLEADDGYDDGYDDDEEDDFFAPPAEDAPVKSRKRKLEEAIAAQHAELARDYPGRHQKPKPAPGVDKRSIAPGQKDRKGKPVTFNKEKRQRAAATTTTSDAEARVKSIG
ncbi:hypothetical protein JL720_7821 [Aureococcus anophagefferens]|nr:hypothetical protein JL720_7821 [Aureococcus anophagefferens]